MKTINSVATLIPMFVLSTPKLIKPITTAIAAMTNAQCEPIHFASQFANRAKNPDIPVFIKSPIASGVYLGEQLQPGWDTTEIQATPTGPRHENDPAEAGPSRR
jgi:hypothetical protein